MAQNGGETRGVLFGWEVVTTDSPDTVSEVRNWSCHDLRTTHLLRRTVPPRAQNRTHSKTD